MKKIPLLVALLLSGVILITSCTRTPPEQPSDWKLGVALFSFHTFSFPEALAKADSAGVSYVEGFTFGKAGAELNDSIVMTLSPAGVEKLKQLVRQSGLRMESIYVVGGSTMDAWKKEFDIARQLEVKYVTGEPPIALWDRIDSMAGVYGIKVAIHNHWKGASKFWHPDSVLAALKNHPNFGACPDVGHWPKSGIDPVEGIKKLEGHIIAMHLKDIAEANNPKLNDVRVGTGINNFPGIFAELKRQKFSGYIMIERDEETRPSNLQSVIETVKYYEDEVAKLK